MGFQFLEEEFSVMELILAPFVIHHLVTNA
jgi:hypothetical protein